MRLIDADLLIQENANIIDCDIIHPKYEDTLREIIERAPTVINLRENVRGEWLHTGDGSYNHSGYYMCSECGATYVTGENFCSNCGSYNRGENNETD